VYFVFEFVLELVWKWKFVWGMFDEFVLELVWKWKFVWGMFNEFVLVGWLNQSF